MRLPFAAVALTGAVVCSPFVLTPARAELAGPVNLPPSSYQGLQFVDQTGCLFLRAGYGAQTIWVPMVDENHKPICDMSPSLGAAAAPVTAPAPPPAPAASPAAPVTVAAASAPAAAPAARKAVTPAAPHGYQVASLGTTTASCPGHAPVLERAVLRNGGTALVCTQGDGTLTGWSPPVFSAGEGVGAALGYATPTNENLQGARMAGPAVAAPAAPAAVAVAPVTVVAARTTPAPPKGWKAAWKDDRLNPLRGVGTAEGQAMQDLVWTRDVPAQLVNPPVLPHVAAAAPVVAVTRLPTMSAPAVATRTASAVGTSAVYVQIGGFAVNANAQDAVARIAALGLPQALGRQSRGGQVLQVVFAGPFATSSAAQSALASLKGAGFRDAFIR